MKKIIVADDSKIVQNIITKILEDEYEVLNAKNGKDVINFITDKENDISCILLDLNMPDYDGFYVLNYFKNNNLFKKYPISIITGDDTKETIDKAFNYNIVDMLNKPFIISNVKDIVNKMLTFNSMEDE